MKRALRDNGLSLAFGILFLGTLVGQAFVGLADFNAGQIAHHGDPISLWRYIRSSEFGVDVLENWQSEYLQFSLFIFGTVWLLQRGSPESKELDKAGRESDAEQKIRSHGFRTWLFSNSLLLVMGTIWLASWFGQSVTGRVAYNAERFDHQQAARDVVAVPGLAGFLEPHAAELAVGVPGRRLDGGAVDLSAPARLAGVQAGRRAALRDRRRGLSRVVEDDPEGGPPA